MLSKALFRVMTRITRALFYSSHMHKWESCVVFYVLYASVYLEGSRRPDSTRRPVSELACSYDYMS